MVPQRGQQRAQKKHTTEHRIQHETQKEHAKILTRSPDVVVHQQFCDISLVRCLHEFITAALCVRLVLPVAVQDAAQVVKLVLEHHRGQACDITHVTEINSIELHRWRK